MLSYVITVFSIGLIVNAQQFVENESGLFLCSKLKPIKNLEIHKLQGKWDAFQMFEFRRGVPAFNISGARIQNTLQNCNFELVNITTKEISMKTYNELRKFRIVGANKGRWDASDRQFLVIAADPAKFMVWAECKTDPPAEVDSIIPQAPQGDRFLSEVTLIYRDAQKMTQSQIAHITENMKKLVGFKSYEKSSAVIKC